jgi:hypothetical protein
MRIERNDERKKKKKRKNAMKDDDERDVDEMMIREDFVVFGVTSLLMNL